MLHHKIRLDPKSRAFLDREGLLAEGRQATWNGQVDGDVRPTGSFERQ